jgi:pyruvate/2-oxoglutarate dehydrogenase complex dihydrolipoamide dehydrogenase (E3) component
MNATRFDAIVIGSGQAGSPLAVRLANTGRRVAIIERERYGGTCVNNGCMPTKTLVASAYAAHLARRGAEFGVVIDTPIRVDMRRVKQRKDEVAQRARWNVERWLKGIDDLTVVEGHARFESPNTIRVGKDLLQADRIFVNVGGRPLVPQFSGLNEVDYFTSSSIMEIDFLPEHLIVVGGSYIGLEFAQIYRRFGARVTVIEKFPRIVPREDPDVSDTVAEILRNEGIAVETAVDCVGFRKRGRDIAVKLECASGGHEVVGSHVLLAVGRIPNTGDLGLDRAGVRTDRNGFIVVDEELRTNVEGIYAIGDCNGRGSFTHTSYNDYEIVADNLLNGTRRTVLQRLPTYALFIDPPLARAGLTDTEVRRSGRKALFAKRPMMRVGRAVEKGETHGFMKVAVDAETKQILGAAILGVGGDEAIHALVDAMNFNMPYPTLQRAVHIHPTVAELIPTLLGELAPA